MNYHFSSFGNPLRWLKNAYFAATTFYGGSGGGAPANTTSQVTTSNIPDYMKPYAKAMLGGAMGQAFQTDSKGNITGTRPYVPYGVDPALFSDPRLTNPLLSDPKAQKNATPEEIEKAIDAQRRAVERGAIRTPQKLSDALQEEYEAGMDAIREANSSIITVNGKPRAIVAGLAPQEKTVIDDFRDGYMKQKNGKWVMDEIKMRNINVAGGKLPPEIDAFHTLITDRAEVVNNRMAQELVEEIGRAHV